jgi:hypothetical protein
MPPEVRIVFKPKRLAFRHPRHKMLETLPHGSN